MRTKLLSLLFLAGTVVGCASNPPPPPPMAEAPPPPPPASIGPVDGMYKGMATLAADAPKSCAKLNKPQSVTVKNNTFMISGLKVMVAPDGTMTAAPRKGTSLTGKAFPGGMNFTLVKGKCSYDFAMGS